MVRQSIHNMFFALRPPPVIARMIAMVAERLGSDGVSPERLHITLFILSGLPMVSDRLVAALRDIGDAVAMAPFDVVFDRVIGSDGYVALRPGHRVKGVSTLHDRLVDLAHAAGMAPRGKRRFAPHMSLLYRGGITVNERIAPIRWAASELLLIDSHVGLARHVVKGRWPLVGEPDAQLSLF